MAAYSMMFMGMAPFGAPLAGALAHLLGAPTTVALGGAVCIVAAVVFRLRLPVLRHEAQEIIIALQMAGGAPAGGAISHRCFPAKVLGIVGVGNNWRPR